MKVKLIIFALLILSLFIVSCDRFDKPTKGEGTDIDYNVVATNFFTDFSTTTNLIDADNTADFMDYFHADYLHDGKTKQDIADIINGIFLVNEPRFIKVEFISNNELLVVWDLIISTTDDVVINTMNFADQLKKEGNNYSLYGNRSAPVNEEKLMPFVEIMTATWCGTCPEVEAAMHDYLYSNPDNFFYLEFHTQDAIAGEHEFFDNFYGQTSPPVAILQGKDVFSGDHSDTYPGLLDAYQEMDAQLKLSNLIQTSGTENYQAKIDIEKLITEDFDTTNLKLRWAFYEEVSSVNNYVGDPCVHVVLTEGLYDISTTDINSSFSVSIDYPRDTPDDMGIVFWLQTANDTYDDDSFVHAWIKQDVRSK